METRIHHAMECEAERSDAINLCVFIYFYINIFILGEMRIFKFLKTKNYIFAIIIAIQDYGFGYIYNQLPKRSFTNDLCATMGLSWNRKGNVEHP